MARLKLSWKNFLESRIQNLSSVFWNRETSKPKPRALHKKMLTRVQPLWGDFCISHASSTIKTGQQTGLATDRLLRIRFMQEISRHFYQWQVILLQHGARLPHWWQATGLGVRSTQKEAMSVCSPGEGTTPLGVCVWFPWYTAKTFSLSDEGGVGGVAFIG